MVLEMGPVQLLAFRFDRPKFGGSIATELARLSDQGVIRVLDALVIQKDSAGELRLYQVTDLTPVDYRLSGSIIGKIIGLVDDVDLKGIEPTDSGPQAWDILGDIKPESAAGIVLIEHLWAIQLSDAIRFENGIPIGDAWLPAEDITALKLAS